MDPAPDSPSSRPTAPRRFTLLDGIILIAAVALGLAVARPAILFMIRDLSSIPVPTLDTPRAWGDFLFGRNQLALNATRFGNIILLNFLFFLELAFAILRLCPPRPPSRDLIRQPGFAAFVGALLGVLVAFLLSPLPLPSLVMQIIPAAGMPTAWVVLIATGNWRPEPGWIDRFGRWLGAIFMVSLAAHLVLVNLPL